jgi:hypothetical protein
MTHIFQSIRKTIRRAQTGASGRLLLQSPRRLTGLIVLASLPSPAHLSGREREHRRIANSLWPWNVTESANMLQMHCVESLSEGYAPLRRAAQRQPVSTRRYVLYKNVYGKEASKIDKYRLHEVFRQRGQWCERAEIVATVHSKSSLSV